MNSQKVRVTFGPPGSGKDTHASELEKKFGMSQLGVGQLCRDRCKVDSEFKVNFEKHWRHHEVPFKEIESMYSSWIELHKKDAQVIYNGMPRNKEQFSMVRGLWSKNNIDDVIFIFISVTYVELWNRALKAYNEGGRKGRDEKFESYDQFKYNFESRYSHYLKVEYPVIELAKEHGFNVITVDGSRKFGDVHGTIINHLIVHDRSVKRNRFSEKMRKKNHTVYDPRAVQQQGILMPNSQLQQVRAEVQV